MGDANMKNTEYQNTPLHAAAGSGSTKATDLLLAAGSQVDAKDRDNLTPLHWSVRGSHDATASILLKAGADVHARTDTGYTPFGMSEEWSSYSMTKLLEDA